MARELVNTINKNRAKNLLLNSNMGLAQRGTSIPGTGGFQYLLDRWIGWFSNPGSGTGETLSQSSLPAGFPGLDYNSNAFRAFITVADAITFPPSINRLQRIESIRLRDDNTQKVSVGFWGWASTMQNCVIEIYEPQSPDNWGSQTLLQSVTIPVTDSGWKYYSLEDVGLNNQDGLEIRISFTDPSGTTFADTYITEVMCNSGEEVGTWSLAEKTQDEERLACDRYYEVFTTRLRAALQSGTNEFPITYVPKRLQNPAFTLTPSSGNTINQISDNSICVTTSNAATGNLTLEIEAEL